MKKVILIDTEIGKVPALITGKRNAEGEDYYTGTILGEHSIFIEAKTEAFCIDQLQKAFELLMHFWVRSEFAEINLSYETKVSKNWYNEWQ